MDLIAEIPYEETKFVYISSHWDHHRAGLCLYEGKYCWFVTDDKSAEDFVDRMHDEEDEDYDEPYEILTCLIYRLTFREKLSKLSLKMWFEFCVGRHWTYYNGKRGPHFGTPDWKPKWLKTFLFKLFYKMRKLWR